MLRVSQAVRVSALSSDLALELAPSQRGSHASPCAEADAQLTLLLYLRLHMLHWRRKWQPTPVFSPGEFHGQRSLAGYPPWGRRELDRTEQLTHTQMLHKQSLLLTTKRRTAQWGPNHQWRGRRIRAELPIPTRSAWQLRSVGAVGSTVTGCGKFTPCFPLPPVLPM